MTKRKRKSEACRATSHSSLSSHSVQPLLADDDDDEDEFQCVPHCRFSIVSSSQSNWSPTPSPGLYHIRDFLEEAELNPVRKTYGFKGVGRRVQPPGVRKGDLLLPGAYDHTDSIQEVLRNRVSYSFKNCPRPDIFTLGVRDKHINTSPCDYNVTAEPVEKIPCKHVMFRSSVQRISFPPKEGPSPCSYDPQIRAPKGVTSCFRSKLPRLHQVHSKTPGPGAYEPCWKLGDRVDTEATDPSFSLFFRNIV
ncbi:protein STPG4 [Symphorus nematophorus]